MALGTSSAGGGVASGAGSTGGMTSMGTGGMNLGGDSGGCHPPMCLSGSENIGRFNAQYAYTLI